MTHICVSKITTIGSDNALSPGRRQAVIWTNAGILLIWTLGTNFSEMLIKYNNFHWRKCLFLKCHLPNGGHFAQCVQFIQAHVFVVFLVTVYFSHILQDYFIDTDI